MAGWECDHDLPGILYCPATVKLGEPFARLRSQADRLGYFVSALVDRGWERQPKSGLSQPDALSIGFFVGHYVLAITPKNNLFRVELSF